MGSFGLGHLIILGLIIFFFFGRKGLPEIGRTLGRTVKGFKEGLNEIDVEGRDVREISSEEKRTDKTAKGESKSEQKDKQKDG